MEIKINIYIYFIQRNMEHSLFYTDFKTARAAYIEVKSFIEAEAYDKVTSLKTKIAEDLGCYGDDNWYLLNKFVIKYNLDARTFDYSKHFVSESEVFNSGIVFIKILLFPFFFLIWITRLALKEKSWKEIEFYPDWGRKTLDITFADMLIWYLTGRYNVRSNIKVTFHN